MEIEIQNGNLIDSPFTANGNTKIFVFDKQELDDLSSEIKFGNPTCYLMSGYSGVGKTSFMKKLESTVATDEKVLFVHASFAKY